MHADIFALFGIFLLIMFYFAETNKSLRILGILGSILLIALAIFVWNTGLEVQTGTTTTVNQVQNVTTSGSTTTSSGTEAFNWAQFTTPFFDFRVLLGLALCGVGMISGLKYVYETPEAVYAGR